MPQYLAYTYLDLFFFGCVARLLPASAFKRSKIVENQSDRKYHHLKTGLLPHITSQTTTSTASTRLYSSQMHQHFFEDLAASERLQTFAQGSCSIDVWKETDLAAERLDNA